MNSQHTLEKWLTEQCKLACYDINALPGDASFRRYFRITESNRSFIAMDASVEKQSCVPFVAIGRALREQGLSAPDIIASEMDQGFLLLTDFGDQTYLKELTLQNANSLYHSVLDALTVMQTCRQIDGWALKPFTADFMRNELNTFKEWFFEKHLELTLSAKTETLLSDCFTFLAETAANQPQVFMHRDYHSANLMVLPDARVGILDFQDAFIGPVTYDLVSLLRDCYIDWPPALVEELVLYYWKNLSLPNVTAEEFLRWFDLMGLQRHLKCLLTFSRKYRRDNNAGYLQFIPRTLNYILTVTERYPECAGLHSFLTEKVLEKCVE
ncbi:MAG: phosphotransferase [Gammaproteobacteria bacterium]